MINLINNECLMEMENLVLKGVTVDMILTDPPYGTTSCTWDTHINFNKMWHLINKLIKDNRCIALFGNEPFTSTLICSNLKGFKYRLDWDKIIPSGMGYAKFRPMQQTEDIAIFSKTGEKVNYYPQMIKRSIPIKSGGTKYSKVTLQGKRDPLFKKTYDYKNPVTLLKFEKVRRGSYHPMQKPTELLEYMIKTYSNEDDTILDFTMGSGSTGVACCRLKRNFIGIEIDKTYFDIATKRIETEILDLKNKYPLDPFFTNISL